MSHSHSQSNVIKSLTQKLREIERTFRQPGTAGVSARSSVNSLRSPTEDVNPETGVPTGVVPTGIPALDQILPARGFRRGGIVEWLTDGPGTGIGRLVLKTASRALLSTTDTECRPLFVVIDHQHDFYPLAAIGMGIDPQQIVIIRPQRPQDALWALEQALRCPAVGVSLCRLDQGNDRQFRRLQLAAEVGNGLGFLIRPSSAHRQPNWSDIRLLIKALPAVPTADGSSPVGQRLQIELLHCRGELLKRNLILELDDATSHVSLVTELADPASPQRAAGA